MSNYLAIATVTAAFGAAISKAMHEVPQLSAAPEMRYGRPPADPTFVGANLFLYRVAPSASRRNDDLATRDGAGQLLRLPTAAVELDYLISFYGNEATLEPQRLLGNVIGTLHAAPILDRQAIRRAIEAAGPDNFLAVSDLDQQPEPVRFSPVPLDPDMLHRIWGLFGGSPFAPSLMYCASTLLLSRDGSVLQSLPVRAPQMSASPSMPPVIETIDPARVAAGAGARLHLKARNVSAPCYARFGDLAVEAVVRGGDVLVALPAGLPAGPTTVQLVTGDLVGGTLSPPGAFMLQPRIGDGALAIPAQAGMVVACALSPLPRYAQSAALTLTPCPEARSAGAATIGSSGLLRLAVDGRFADDLDKSVLAPSLVALLKARGILLQADARVLVLQAGASWRIEDAASGQACLAWRDDIGIVVNFGLPSGRPDLTQAFSFGAAPGPGSYLMTAQIGAQSACSSPLRSGVPLFSAVEGADSLDQGVLPDGLRDGFARNGVTLSADLDIVRPLPGDGWHVQDRSSGGDFWIAQSGDGLQVYRLGAAGAYFGPLLVLAEAG